MFNRLWALLLILICGFNALGVSGSAYLSEKEHESVSMISHSDAVLADLSDTAQTIASATHFPDDGHDGDCGTQHQNCHTCHLGHCNFLMNSASGLVTPDLVRAIQNHSAFSYLSIDLSGPRKPPRA
jgi:hypothetical protein